MGGQAIVYCWSMKRGARSGDRDAPEDVTIFTCDTDKNYFLMEEGVCEGCVVMTM